METVPVISVLQRWRQKVQKPRSSSPTKKKFVAEKKRGRRSECRRRDVGWEGEREREKERGKERGRFRSLDSIHA